MVVMLEVKLSGKEGHEISALRRRERVRANHASTLTLQPIGTALSLDESVHLSSYCILLSTAFLIKRHYNTIRNPNNHAGAISALDRDIRTQPSRQRESLVSQGI
jgi:hypothetical protein